MDGAADNTPAAIQFASHAGMQELKSYMEETDSATEPVDISVKAKTQDGTEGTNGRINLLSAE